MRHWIITVVLMLLATLVAALAAAGPGERLMLPKQAEHAKAAQDIAADGAIRFEAVDVFLDSGTTPLAAYQFELTALGGDMKIVGIEGGEHAAFSDPPSYDRKAVEAGQSDRIIIADFASSDVKADALPTGRTRVATIHVQIRGDVEFNFERQAAADAQGNKIKPTLTFQKGHD